MKKIIIQMMVKLESGHLNQHNKINTNQKVKHKINIQFKKDKKEINSEEIKFKRVRLLIHSFLYFS